MKIVQGKRAVIRTAMMSLAAGIMMFAGAAKAQAQQFAEGVQFGHPAYVYDRDGYRQRDGFRGREQREFRDRERREQFEQRQAFFRHEEWERAHRFDRSYDYR